MARARPPQRAIRAALVPVLLLALAATACRGGGEGPPLLLLVSVDTLRADRLGAYGAPAGATPRLDRLMSQSLVFENAFSTCSYTLPSVSALMTGRYPEELGMLGNVALLGSDFATLAGVLELHGWRTGAAVSNYVLRRDSGLDRGFQRYDDHLPQQESNRDVPERVAAPTTEAALELLDELSGDPGAGVFLWVHYQDPHGPYTPPDGLRDRFLAAARRSPRGDRVLQAGSPFGEIPRYQYVEGEHQAAFYMAGYAGEIAYTDAEIGRLLDGVVARGWWQRAVVVFTADHGEGMGENDYWFAHGELLSDPLVRIPLSLHLPGGPVERRAAPVSQLDVFPTLLRHFGIDVPEGYPGRDLLAPAPPDEERRLYLASLRGSRLPRYGLIAGGYKYLVTRRRDGAREELYRLGDEGRDLAGQHPDLVADLRGRLETLREGLHRPRAPSERAIGPEERERLRRLGYAE
jgi:arylsulfatase A-like enzyme